MVKLVAALLLIPCLAVAAPPWTVDELPLPLAARTPDEIAFKAEAERQYLLFNVFNLMAGGKYAYDRGDWATAIKMWEALLRAPTLSPQVEKVVAPLLASARKSLASGAPPPVAAREEGVGAPVAPAAGQTPAAPAPPPPPVVAGTVSGGGVVGPGGTVVWLRNLDRATPQPRARKVVVTQKNKVFNPRVRAVPVGSTVDFRNDDDFYHNVFSLSPTGKFDTGLYAAGKSSVQTFDKPGPVELLCNIHASMIGYLYVVDSAYYAQARNSGSFTIRNVPAGRYELTAWHESSSGTMKQTIRVGTSGLRGVSIRIPNDRRPLVTVPDKYGKPRHPQLGY